MKYTIVPAPEQRRYEWHLLKQLPMGQAIRTEYWNKGEAERARCAAQAYCKYNKIVITTKVTYEADMYALYVSRVGVVVDGEDTHDI